MQRKQKRPTAVKMELKPWQMLKVFVVTVQHITEMLVAGGTVAVVFSAQAVDTQTVSILVVAASAFVICVVLAFLKEVL